MSAYAAAKVVQDRPAKLIQSEDRPWLRFPGVSVDLKVLHVDEDRHIVVVMSRFSKGGNGGKHLHLCEAIAFTSSGEWAYDEGRLPAGATAIEPFGSIHTPVSEPGGEVFVVFVGTGPDLLQALDDEGNVVATTTIEHFKRLFEMTPEEASETDLLRFYQE